MTVRYLSTFFKAMLLALELINLEFLFTSYKQKRLKVRYLRLFALCVKYKFQFKVITSFGVKRPPLSNSKRPPFFW